MSSETETREPVEVDHGPARFSSGLAVLAATLGALLSAPFALLSLPFGAGGVLMVAGGLYVSESRMWVSLGAASVFVGALVSGAFGLPPELVLPSATAALLSWDVGQNAISVGDQLSRSADTRRGELSHALLSTMVAVAVVAVAYGVFRVAQGGQSATALALLLLGALLLTWALRA